MRYDWNKSSKQPNPTLLEFINALSVELPLCLLHAKQETRTQVTHVRGGGQGGRPLPPPAPLPPPPPAPLPPSSLLGAARASRAQNFPLFPSLPFFLPSPSSRPLFSLLPPPPLPPPSPSSPSSHPLTSPLPPPLLPPPSYPVRPLMYMYYMYIPPDTRCWRLTVMLEMLRQGWPSLRMSVTLCTRGIWKVMHIHPYNFSQ